MIGRVSRRLRRRPSMVVGLATVHDEVEERDREKGEPQDGQPGLLARGARRSCGGWLRCAPGQEIPSVGNGAAAVDPGADRVLEGVFKRVGWRTWGSSWHAVNFRRVREP